MDHASEYVFGQLQPKERAVLRLIPEGMRNREIGEALGISEQTVANYLRRIYVLLGVETRVSAAMWVVNHPAFRERLESACSQPSGAAGAPS